MSDDWCTIESDPGVFTALCEEIGVKGVQFEEVYSLDADTMATLPEGKTYGLIFLFKWVTQDDPRPTIDGADHGVFFAQQVIHNACATQAILSVLMNTPTDKVDIGPHLKEFKEFTVCLDAQMKGLAIGNSEAIRRAHNSFKHQSSFEIVQEKDEKGDAFHFIGYICHENRVYELDGLKKGPILIGDAPKDGKPWQTVASAEIQRRIETYNQKAATGGAAEGESAELRFNLMAIVADKMRDAESSVSREKYLRQRANISLVSHGEDVEMEDELDDDEAPANIPSFEELSAREVGDLKAIVAQCTSTIEDQGSIVASEKKRRDQWAKENARRRHDMVPLVLAAMRHLAKKKTLMPAFEKGKATTIERQAAKTAEKAAAK